MNTKEQKMELDIEQAKRDGCELMLTDPSRYIPVKLIHTHGNRAWIEYDNGEQYSVPLDAVSNIPTKTRRVRIPVTFVIKARRGNELLYGHYGFDDFDQDSVRYISHGYIKCDDMTDELVGRLPDYIPVEELPADSDHQAEIERAKRDTTQRIITMLEDDICPYKQSVVERIRNLLGESEVSNG